MPSAPVSSRRGCSREPSPRWRRRPCSTPATGRVPSWLAMRMFVALTPDDEALDELAEFLAPRLAVDPTLRFVDRAQWHVTLAFLPDVAPRCLDDLQDRLARAALRRHDFSIAIAGGGAFPNVGAARVLFGGLDVPDDEELSR